MVILKKHRDTIQALEQIDWSANYNATKRGRSHMIRAGTTHLPEGAVSLLSQLHHILNLDTSSNVLWVEPGVTMDQLVRWSLPHGLVPPVVPEFKNITVGGSIMGAAIESSSFRHGQFNDSCLEYEVLLGDGTVIWVSPTKEPALFYGLSGSYGTLGRLLSVKLQLVPARKYVHLTYYTIPNVEDVGEHLTSVCQDPSSPDYVEGIGLTDGRAVIIAGRLSDQATNVTNLSRPDAMWYYQFVQQRVDQGATSDWCDCLSLYDYLFRLDRAAFWMGQYVTHGRALLHFLSEGGLYKVDLSHELRDAYRACPPTLNPGLLRRLLLSWKLSSGSLYRILHALPQKTFANTYMVQDFYIPISNVKTFLKYLRQHIRVMPLWFCPVRGTHTPQIVSPHFLNDTATTHTPHFINIGVYGVPQATDDVPTATRELEALTERLGGRKMLYSWCYYPEDEFWRIYPKEQYINLRKKYRTNDNTPDLYQRLHAKL